MNLVSKIIMSNFHFPNTIPHLCAQRLKISLVNFYNKHRPFSKHSLHLSRTKHDGNNVEIDYESAPGLPNESDCCGDGCQNCVWLTYVTHVKFHCKNDDNKLKEALNSVPKGDIREFVKLELKQLMEKS